MLWCSGLQIANGIAQSVVVRLNHATNREPMASVPTFVRLLSVLCGETHAANALTPDLYKAVSGVDVAARPCVHCSCLTACYRRVDRRWMETACSRC